MWASIKDNRRLKIVTTFFSGQSDLQHERETNESIKREQKLQEVKVISKRIYRQIKINWTNPKSYEEVRLLCTKNVVKTKCFRIDNKEVYNGEKRQK